MLSCQHHVMSLHGADMYSVSCGERYDGTVGTSRQAHSRETTLRTMRTALVSELSLRNGLLARKQSLIQLQELNVVPLGTIILRSEMNVCQVTLESRC